MNQKTIIEFDLILLAAGKGERMGFQKQFATIGNLPIWRIALDQIRTHSSCKTVIIVFPKNAPFWYFPQPLLPSWTLSKNNSCFKIIFTIRSTDILSRDTFYFIALKMIK